MLGTKRPSITSTWIQSAPAASTARTSSARRPKSADRMDGATTSGLATRRSARRRRRELGDLLVQPADQRAPRLHERVAAVLLQLECQGIDVDALATEFVEHLL